MEGYVKFTDMHVHQNPVNYPGLDGLMYWRNVLFQVGLIGEEDGIGYGNVSMRLGDDFVISGTRTGGTINLKADGYTKVVKCSPRLNRVVSIGPVGASSESMTHDAVYRCDPKIKYVVHVHSKEMWKLLDMTRKPATPENAKYGTPEMAEAVSRLFAETNVRSERIFWMAGHEDGVVSFGETVDVAGEKMLKHLAEAATLLGAA